MNKCTREKIRAEYTFGNAWWKVLEKSLMEQKVEQSDGGINEVADKGRM